MFRFLLCVSLCAACCAPLQAGSVLGNNPEPVHAPNPDDNIFNVLNQELRNIPKTDPRLDRKTGMYMDEGMPGAVPMGRAAICNICKELLYKHSDPAFECIPVTADGERIRLARIIWRTAKCPVCQAEFQGALRGNVNDKAGLDRDFCAHSLGKVTVHSNVWSCPDCGYGALIDKFDTAWNGKPLGPDIAEFVRKNLSQPMRERMIKQVGINEKELREQKEAGQRYAEVMKRFHNLERFAEYIPQDQIKDWIKYDNAIATYKQEHAPHVLMARLYLEGAHACRRELNNELSVPFLHTYVQEGISQSIRRVQNDLLTACLQIRRDRKLNEVFDPTKPETDPGILVEASKLLIQYRERSGERIRRESQPTPANSAAPTAQYYTTGDIYVLYLRYAGFLDRLGRFDEASKALGKSLEMVPLNPNLDNQGAIDADMVAFVEKQLQRLREFVNDRKKCLDKEKEFITRAMWETLAAIHQKEIRFNEQYWFAATEKDGNDPAKTAYTLGELARRCGEPAAAPVWFAAADVILDRQSKRLDEEEEAATTAAAAKGLKPPKELTDHATVVREQWNVLRDCIVEQRALAKYEEGLDPNIKLVLEDVLRAAGLDPAYFKMPDAAATADMIKMQNATNAMQKNAGLNMTPAKPAAETPKFASSGNIQTRDQLFTLYYDAIKRYFAAKKANPDSLLVLVKEGYIAAEDSCLDAKGNLFCPRTKEQLLYSRTFTLGNPEECIFFPMKNKQTTKRLFADGKARAPQPQDE